ncbi:GntR family transcriptional regulator [Nonomuraea sp. LPB2021202275-12-8]|uniref:GntR family transcriptional regulator n=1 Tax=Nonomuraea sp. LPB2021202275-12-8 TaxID=3120159 RepID=UPI00300C2634
MFAFRLESHSGVPPYLQLVHQVRQALLLGYLRQGDQLPRIREAVEQLAINPNTVSKAYQQLEQEGLVTPRPGLGTFVTGAPRVTVTPALYTALRRDLERWLRGAYAVGLDQEAVTALFSTARRELGEEEVVA